ncbi:MAG: hypothetical protein ACR2MT_05090 [Aurantibacter sp.]
MSKIFESLLNYLKKKPSPGDGTTPEGLCPNCWGQQEYGGKFFEAVKNYDVDINAKDPHVGWVAEYANKYLTRIALKEHDDKLVCQSCKIVYKPK